MARLPPGPQPGAFMPCTFTPAFCRIDLAALRRNFRRLGDPAGLMPVIKSDAYGHGLLPVAAALADAGARRFAVGTASEGLFIVLILLCKGKSPYIFAKILCRFPIHKRGRAAHNVEFPTWACQRLRGRAVARHYSFFFRR